ncbi:MAG: hypothetical protein WC539_10185 [Nitrospirota bacterium]
MQVVLEKLDRIFASRRFTLVAFAIIAGLILLAYSNTFTANFHFDDTPAIVDNHALKRLSWSNFISMFSGTRPVINVSLFFNYQISKLNPIGWHIVNIGFHIMNSFFFFLLLQRTLQLPSLAERYSWRAKRMALFGALLFGLHPVQTEAVTYIISRTELIATFFYLATFLFFIKHAQTKKFGYAFLAFVMSLLAMQSKEWAVTLPATLFLYDFLFLSNGSFKPILSRWKAYVLVALPWALVAYVLMTTTLQGAGFGVSGERSITPWTYLLTSMNVLWTYIRLLILPINQNLDYGYPIAKTLFAFPTLLSFIGHVLVLGLAVLLFLKKRWTLIPFGILWFYVTLSPTQSFVPILDVIFEHRVYLPSMGYVIVFIVLFERVFEWFAKRKSAALAVPN